MSQDWKVLESEVVLDNQWAKVRKDKCLLPNGIVVPDYYYWESGDFAQVFAITSESEVAVVSQYRHGARSVVLELPAGLIENDSDPLDTAKRELLEETGYGLGSWKPIGTLNISPAKSTTRAFGYLASDIKYLQPPKPDLQEQLELKLVPVEQLLRHAAEGSIRDSTSLAFIFLALQHLRSS